MSCIATSTSAGVSAGPVWAEPYHEPSKGTFIICPSPEQMINALQIKISNI